jgi:hypothetical protein
LPLWTVFQTFIAFCVELEVPEQKAAGKMVATGRLLVNVVFLSTIVPLADGFSCYNGAVQSGSGHPKQITQAGSLWLCAVSPPWQPRCESSFKEKGIYFAFETALSSWIL